MNLKKLKTFAARVLSASVATSVIAMTASPAHASFPFVASAKTLIADSAEFLGLYVGLLVVIVGICIGVFGIATGRGDGAKTMVMALFAGLLLGGLVQIATYAYGLGGGGGITL